MFNYLILVILYKYVLLCINICCMQNNVLIICLIYIYFVYTAVLWSLGLNLMNCNYFGFAGSVFVKG